MTSNSNDKPQFGLVLTIKPNEYIEFCLEDGRTIQIDSSSRITIRIQAPKSIPIKRVKK